MQAKLQSTPKDFFKHYVSLLNPLLKLRKKEAEVLEAHLRVYYLNSRLPDIDRLLFSFPIQKQIRNELKMSASSYNNHKTRLRRKQCIIRQSISPLIINKQIISTIRKTARININYQLEVIKAQHDRPTSKADSKQPG